MSAALLGLALLVPAAVGAALWTYVRRRRRVAASLGDRGLVARVVGEDLYRAPAARVAAILLAAAAIGVALVDPRWGVAAEAVGTRGGRVVLVLDASSSMLAEDVAPNRLELQRQAARVLARSLPDAALAVVVFAGRAYALVPPTTDRGALELYLDALEPAMVTQTGSSLTAAVRQGLGLLAAGESGAAGGALVLVSDGDAPESEEQVREVADLARRAGVPVYTLGAGTARGAPVPDVDLTTGEVLGVKREPDGEPAISRLNAELLREIAASTGGTYAALADPGAVDALAQRLREREGAGVGASGQRPARYAWFAAAALVLLVAESLAGAVPFGRPR